MIERHELGDTGNLLERHRLGRLPSGRDQYPMHPIGDVCRRAVPSLVASKRSAGEGVPPRGTWPRMVTALVDRMEAAGLLRRSYDPTDRRKVWVELTAEAQKLGDEMYGPLNQTGQMPDALSDEQLFTIIGFLDLSRRITMESVEAIRGRTATKAVPLRYRLEQAKMLKNDAKTLLKTIKNEVKGLTAVVIDIHGSKWEQDERGRSVERSD